MSMPMSMPRQPPQNNSTSNNRIRPPPQQQHLISHPPQSSPTSPSSSLIHPPPGMAYNPHIMSSSPTINMNMMNNMNMNNMNMMDPSVDLNEFPALGMDYDLFVVNKHFHL
eukprot:Pgem_evm1s4934